MTARASAISSTGDTRVGSTTSLPTWARKASRRSGEDSPQLVGAAQHDVQVVALVGCDLARQPVEQDGDELVDRVERRPQLVRDVRKELILDRELLLAVLLELVVRALEIAGALGDALGHLARVTLDLGVAQRVLVGDRGLRGEAGRQPLVFGAETALAELVAQSQPAVGARRRGQRDDEDGVDRRMVGREAHGERIAAGVELAAWAIEAQRLGDDPVSSEGRSAWSRRRCRRLSRVTLPPAPTRPTTAAAAADDLTTRAQDQLQELLGIRATGPARDQVSISLASRSRTASTLADFFRQLVRHQTQMVVLEGLVGRRVAGSVASASAWRTISSVPSADSGLVRMWRTPQSRARALASRSL
jgi:hypothetical protein